ncbi:hypothetical protein QVD17_27590 [Tagetes erecta]|uniref:PGG domain-containing protein n=1 Tax=Tagetes erecta TaxID=13708 RepID=A0AAD8K8S0_TARER|nr:hypothetical protein QVD17_27590 [Tagetes erecta]
MEGSSNHLQSASARIQDYEYFYASNTITIGMHGIVDATFVQSSDFGPETMKKYDSLVKGWIFGSVSEDVLVDIYHLDSAKDVWEKIKSIYEPTMCHKNADSTRRGLHTKKDIEDREVIIAETDTIEQGSSSMEIIVLRERETKHEYTQTNKNKIKLNNHIEEILRYKKFREVMRHGDWSRVNHVILHEPIIEDGSTVLHLAVGMRTNDMLKIWLMLVNEEYVLKKRNSDGSTALHVAAIVGNTYAAKLLVEKNSALLRVVDHSGEKPLHKAYQNMHLDTIVYLLIAMKHYAIAELQSSLPGSVYSNDEIVVDILVNVISAKQYGLALDLLQTFPNSSMQSDNVLMAIAKTFPKGLNNGEKLFYPFLSTFVENMRIEASRFVMQCCFLPRLVYDSCVSQNRQPRGLIVDIPVMVVTIHDFGSQNIDKAPHIDIMFPIPCFLFPIVEMCKDTRAPWAIQSRDKNGYDIIQLAIIHRSEKVFNLIYEIGERKNLYRTIEDSSENNILHLGGKLAPSSVLNQIIGAALQLQRELQWREEVKKLVIPTYITKENMFKETPDMIFTREHKDLVKEGEKWMKAAAESCSITAALITTIVFAAAITVPGGSSQDKGTPLFKKESAFIVFAISDALSLFTSITALLVFLSILTTRFAEHDFLISLPRRLLIGLFSLLVSTTAMMVAFSSTLFLVFCDKNPWMLVPICALAFLPVAFFVNLQLPLMLDLSMSTYFTIFGEKRVSIVKGNDPDNMLLLCG